MFTKLLGELKSLAGRPQVRVDALPAGSDYKVTSCGLRDAGLPEIEIARCPTRLCEVASSLVSHVAKGGLMEPSSIASGKIIGGRFVSSDQQLIEIFRLEEIEVEPAAALRIVDLQDQDQGFPHRLVATHLCATAGTARREALRLLLVAVEVWPKEKNVSNAPLGDFEMNPHNFWSWIDLGTTLAQSNQIDQAIANWKTAVCMWPRGGKLYASRMLSKGQPAPGWGGKGHLPHEFWQSVSDDSIRLWCAQLDVELIEGALQP